jgi:hypothetical protein
MIVLRFWPAFTTQKPTDADVVSIETSRSKVEWLNAVRRVALRKGDRDRAGQPRIGKRQVKPKVKHRSSDEGAGLAGALRIRSDRRTLLPP